MFSIFTGGSGGGGAKAVGAGSDADGVGIAVAVGVAEGADATLGTEGVALAGSGCCIGVEGARSQATPGR
jgi:hypothetical protein